MTLGVVIVLLGGLLAGFVGLYLAIRQLMYQKSEQQLTQLVERTFGKTASVVAEQARQVLQGEKEIIKNDLENKQVYFEKLFKTFQEDVKQRQLEIRSLEQDRVRKFAELQKTLELQTQTTSELRITTEQLARVLSNNQQRGEWGERIIEDLLRANGLVEGVHYERQKRLAGGQFRPDIVLLLPDHKMVAVDVKFPLSAMHKLAVAETKQQTELHLKQFSSDLKQKIEQVAQYINPELQTLDYALMFVPNEMVFSYINQHLPELVDEAMRRRVLLVSPFTFLIVARTVLESYRNFMLSDHLRGMLQSVDEFVGEWNKFREAFEKYGRSLTTLQTDYEKLTQTRFRKMERKIEQISNVSLAVEPNYKEPVQVLTGDKPSEDG
ncbi:DNA recombination protein RmuC [Candidatus Woesebacteria bacterium]|nr:DNA recombination protein RmuC [Candidatus Woesebacteria bacterium]